MDLDAALQDISMSVPYPLFKDNIDDQDNAFGKCVPIKDYVDARLFVEIVVKTLPVDKLRDLLDVLVMKMPGVLVCSRFVMHVLANSCLVLYLFYSSH